MRVPGPRVRRCRSDAKLLSTWAMQPEKEGSHCRQYRARSMSEIETFVIGYVTINVEIYVFIMIEVAIDKMYNPIQQYDLYFCSVPIGRLEGHASIACAAGTCHLPGPLAPWPHDCLLRAGESHVDTCCLSPAFRFSLLAGPLLPCVPMGAVAPGTSQLSSMSAQLS